MIIAKKIIIALVITCLILITNTVNSSEDSIKSSGDLENKTYQEILSIDIDDDSVIDYYLRYNDKEIIAKAGVETFSVESGERIYLSNFATGGIYIYQNNSYVDKVDISDYPQPWDIEITEDEIYILEDSGRITEYISSTNGDMTEYTVPAMIYNKGLADQEQDIYEVMLFENNPQTFDMAMPVRLINDFQNKKIAVLYTNNLMLWIEERTITEISLNKFEPQITGGQVYTKILAIDDNGYIYILGTEVREKNDKIEIKELIYRINKDGEVIAVAETVNDENFIVPFKYLDINSSGEAYQLLVLEEQLKVYKLHFIEDIETVQGNNIEVVHREIEFNPRETEYNNEDNIGVVSEEVNTGIEDNGTVSMIAGSTEDESAQAGSTEDESAQAENTEDEGAQADNTGAEGVQAGSTEVKDIASRRALYKEALELINLIWTYDPTNNGVKLNNVEIPYYLQRLDQKQEMRGIPYCWGGYDSLSTKSANQDWDNYLDAISRGNIAGNVGVTSYYAPGTSGLDCSGLISTVLRLDSRKPSWYFYYNNELVKKTKYSQLSLMDILVKNGHMMFFVDENEYGITTIETNIMGSEWKAKYFNWSWRALSDMGYSARTYQNVSSFITEE